MSSTIPAIEPFPHVPKSHFLNKGGFGEVFRDPRGNGLCLKRFNKPLTGDSAHRLQRLIDLAASSRPSVRELLVDRMSWPVQAYGTVGEIHGYSMPEAPAETWFSLTSVKRETTQLLQLKYLISPSYWASPAISSPPPQVSLQDRLSLAIDFYDVLTLLHSRGLVYGDISANNVCVRRSRPMRVFLLDADSIMTPAERLLDHQQSPDWDVPVSGEPLAEERSRFALLVWRLLREDQFERPVATLCGELDRRASSGLGRTLVDLYSTGDERLFTLASDQLRSGLGRTEISAMFSADAATRFADYVTKWQPHHLDQQQRSLLGRALAHTALERRIRSATGFEKRILLRTASVDTTFRLDLEPGVESLQGPRSVAELEQLVLDAEFAALAGHLAGGELGALENHPWVGRAVRHALAGADELVPEIRTATDRTSVTWTWPRDRWVNAAVFDVAVGGQQFREVVRRESSDRTATREVAAAPGSSGHVRITPGTQSPQGGFVPGRSGRDWTFTTPTPPRPARPSTANLWGGSGPTAAIVDPAAEARAIAQAMRERRRRRIKWTVVTAVCTSVAMVTAWFMLKPEPKQLSATATPYGLKLEWPIPDKAQPIRVLLIQSSPPGLDDWQTRLRVEPTQTEALIPHPVDDRSYRVMGVLEATDDPTSESPAEVALGGTVKVDGAAVPAAVLGQAAATGDKTFTVRWTPTPGELIDRYEIQVWASWPDRSGSYVSVARVGGAASSTTVSGIGESNRFFVRAVNANGQAGPWQETELQK